MFPKHEEERHMMINPHRFGSIRRIEVSLRPPSNPSEPMASDEMDEGNYAAGRTTGSF
jgi:hypothetical protein